MSWAYRRGHVRHLSQNRPPAKAAGGGSLAMSLSLPKRAHGLAAEIECAPLAVLHPTELAIGEHVVRADEQRHPEQSNAPVGEAVGDVCGDQCRAADGDEHCNGHAYLDFSIDHQATAPAVWKSPALVSAVCSLRWKMWSWSLSPKFVSSEALAGVGRTCRGRSMCVPASS